MNIGDVFAVVDALMPMLAFPIGVTLAFMFFGMTMNMARKLLSVSENYARPHSTRAEEPKLEIAPEPEPYHYTERPKVEKHNPNTCAFCGGHTSWPRNKCEHCGAPRMGK